MSCQNETVLHSEAPGAPYGLPMSETIIIRPSARRTGRREDQPPAGTLVVMPLIACAHFCLYIYCIWNHLDRQDDSWCVFSTHVHLSVHYQHLCMFVWTKRTSAHVSTDLNVL